MARPPSRGKLRSTLDSVFLHDMKNLEFRLSLLLSNLEEHYGDPDFKRNVVELLQSSLEKVDSVVDRWSAYRDAVLIKVPLDLNDLVAGVTRRARSREDGRQPSIDLRAAPLPSVWGDPNYLSDALLSVIQNALEAAGPSGHVIVSTGAEYRRRLAYAIVTVTDDGPGMTRDFQRTKLFHPFQTTKQRGVGLGLYTARNIVRFHEGQLSVRSAPGQGTTVRISLRAERESATS
jgi:signal transduction histidine kinase